MKGSLEAEITALETLDLPQLRRKWHQVSSAPLPPLKSPVFLRYLIAWKMQEKVLGGLSPGTKRRLKDLQRAFKNNPDYSPSGNFNLMPGTVLTRFWGGKRHDALILEKGVQYEGKVYGSLSEVATHITGSRWSGPLFFGLKQHCSGAPK